MHWFWKVGVLYYEGGSRRVKAIRPFLERFIGFYTTDGYVCYKVFDTTDEELAKLEASPPEGIKKRSACLVHIRRLFENIPRRRGPDPTSAVLLHLVNPQKQLFLKIITQTPIDFQWVGEVNAY